VPLHDDKLLFEFLVLCGFQAGLSWNMILNKRDNFRLAFDNFDAALVAKYDETKFNSLIENSGIVRNKMKISSAIQNAKSFLEVQKSEGSFNKYIWSFVDHKPITNIWKSMKDVPAKTEIAELMSKQLKRRGFKFVGPTICYAFMQSIGLVNDHSSTCFRHAEIKKMA